MKRAVIIGSGQQACFAALELAKKQKS